MLMLRLAMMIKMIMLMVIVMVMVMVMVVISGDKPTILGIERAGLEGKHSSPLLN